jgi:hypothetical protein
MRREFLPDAGDELPGYVHLGHGGRRNKIRWGGNAIVATANSPGANSGPPPMAPVVLEVPNAAQELGEPSPLIGVTFAFSECVYPAALPTQQFRVFGEVKWQNDGARGLVELDLPFGLSNGASPPYTCGGACVAVPAASGLIVRAWAEGLTGFTARVFASASRVSSPYPQRPVRSRRMLLPMGAGLPIPPMARSVRIYGQNAAALATVQLILTAVGGALGDIIVRGAATQEYLIPAGAANWQCVDLAPVPVAQVVTAVFEVGL